jgi:hypothetical protein
MIAPGRACLAYADGSCAENRSLDGTGKKDPYSASARFPDSVQMGSWTVTRNTLQERVSVPSCRIRLIIPVREGSLNLNLVKQCLYTGKDVPSPQQRFSMLHELRDGVLAIPDAFLKHGSDESDCFRLVEDESSSESLLGEGACLKHGRFWCAPYDEAG